MTYVGHWQRFGIRSTQQTLEFSAEFDGIQALVMFDSMILKKKMVPFPSAACMILIWLVKCSHYSCLSVAIVHRVFCDPKKNQNCGMVCGFETSKPRNSQLAVEDLPSGYD